MGPALHGPDEVAWAPRFEADLDNLRAAVAWSMDAGAAADVELGLRIVSSLAGQEFSRPPAGVGEWAEAALEHAETANPRYRAAVLAMAAWRELLQGDPALGRVRATAAFRVGLPPDTPVALWARAALASAEITARDDAAAAFEVLEDGERVLDPIATADDARLALETTTVVVNVYAGRAEAARVRADALVRRARVLANPSRLSQALRWFAETRRPDEIDETIEALDECLALSRAVAILDHADVLQALGLLAKVRAGRGERTPVIVALREAIVRCHDTGQRYVLLSQILNYALSAVADLDAPGLAATLGGVVAGGPLTESAVIPRIRADRDAALERVRAEMTTSEYDAAFRARRRDVVRGGRRLHARRARPARRGRRIDPDHASAALRRGGDRVVFDPVELIAESFRDRRAAVICLVTVDLDPADRRERECGRCQRARGRGRDAPTGAIGSQPVTDLQCPVADARDQPHGTDDLVARDDHVTELHALVPVGRTALESVSLRGRIRGRRVGPRHPQLQLIHARGDRGCDVAGVFDPGPTQLDTRDDLEQLWWSSGQGKHHRPEARSLFRSCP